MGSKRKRNAKRDSVNGFQPSQKRAKTAAAAIPLSTAKLLADKTPFVLHPVDDERRREAALYELLGSEDDAERLQAADVIISSLLGGEGVAGAALVRHLEKRLFRGLASGRKASRLGFSIVITEILRQLFGTEGRASQGKYEGVTFEKILVILLECTDAKETASGQDDRDHLFGRLFGLECFVRAGILFEDKMRWEAILNSLLKLPEKKVWLRSQCGFVIVQAVQDMSQDFAKKTLKQLAQQGLAKTPEGVGIWIAALHRFPKLKVKEPWSNPLAPSFISSLPPILKDSGRESLESVQGKQKQENRTAQLHFVWDIILAFYVKLGDGSKADFQLFWGKVVDEIFFSRKASENQKFSGFMVFQKFLEGGSAFIIESIFSEKFLSCLMNQAAKEDRYLHRAAIKALKAIETKVEQSPVLLEIVLKALLGERGAYNFDERTNTKTIDRLLYFARPEDSKNVLEIIDPDVPSVLSKGSDLKTLLVYGGYLHRLASASPGHLADDRNMGAPVDLALQRLIKLTYSTPNIPIKVREQWRAKVNSAVAKIMKTPEALESLCSAIALIEVDEAVQERERRVVAKTVLVPALERLTELLGSGRGDGLSHQALAILHAIAILQFFNEDPDAVDLLNELQTCHEKLVGKEQGKDTGVSEFLVEILLAMVARPSALMRQVSQQVFEAFTHMISADALKLLTDPLAAEENAKGQQMLFSTEEEDVNDAEDDDVEDDRETSGSELGHADEMLVSDVEIFDVDDAESWQDNEDETSQGSEKDEKVSSLEQALETALLNQGLGKVKDAPELDSDSDLSDSEMMKLDGKLAEIFQLHSKAAGKKKENKNAKESVVNFKQRVLDLLGVFVRKEAAAVNPLVFDVVLPLLELMRTTTAKTLSSQACEVILNLSKHLKKAKTAGKEKAGSPAITKLVALLAAVHGEAGKDFSHAYARAASAASLALASVLCAAKDEMTEAKVFTLYSRTQLGWKRGEVLNQTPHATAG
ncbi:hypothetical protein P8C59_000918 [Phyllachora maydis]|uniref:DNA polymerase V n=1 Tax=Phyllachora maydis TaxID=1825666 RepID=A0AAD9HX57_9PEZI|nr:hypothetical protein P8C59_000918 [Phyllachora maydis]